MEVIKKNGSAAETRYYAKEELKAVIAVSTALRNGDQQDINQTTWDAAILVGTRIVSIRVGPEKARQLKYYVHEGLKEEWPYDTWLRYKRLEEMGSQE